MRHRYVVRAATVEDVPEVLALARHLDTVNLPDDASAVEALLDHSERSFSGAIGDPRRRKYVFLLRDEQEGCAVGTSMIVAQLGRRDAPYIFFDVRREERYSSTLDRHFVHTLLEMGYSYNGPTEIGGLVVAPAYRRAPERLGLFVSYVRFLFMAMHREDFQDEVLAELLPPLEPDGTSHLWEAVGRRFTGLSYREADRLSARNKEFIRGLFPDGPIYATLLPERAQRVIGQVGAQTRGVEKILRRIGFRYAERVDPFDGGPHFVARTDEVSLVVASRPVHPVERETAVEVGERYVVAARFDGAPYFQGCLEVGGPDEAGRMHVSRETLALLEGAEACWAMPTRPDRQSSSAKSLS